MNAKMLVDGAANVEFCVNLCDVLLSAASPCDVAAVIERARVAAGAARVDRVHVGSYLCPAYFAAVCGDPLDVVLRWCAEHGAAATLVVPVASEGEFAQVEACVEDVLGRSFGISAGFIDELCVNDAGMALHAARAWCGDGGVRLCLGRLFDKAPRDPRYGDAFAAERLVDAGELLGLQCFDDMTERCVAGVEVEPTNEQLRVRADGLAVDVHEPYACVTLGRVCAFASAGKPLEQMFRPGVPCVRQCAGACVRYALRDGVELLRVGKGVYARQTSSVGLADGGAGSLRRVYWAVGEVGALLFGGHAGARAD